MKTEKIFLFLGLLFSIVLITFQIENGFEFINIKVNTSIIDVALNKSSKTNLNSTIIGYLCYLVFSFIIWKKAEKNEKALILIFSAFTLIGIIFEFKAFYESLLGIYNGTHFQIGIILAVVGFFILNRINKKS